MIAQPFARAILPRPPGRLLCSWEGVLPITPFYYHRLSVISLIDDDYHGLPAPEKTVPKATQQIAIAHYYIKKPEINRCLLKVQKDFRLPGDSSRRVAMEIGEFLADHMMRIPYSSYVMAGFVTIPNYWIDELDRAFNRLKRQRLQELAISPQAFELEPELYLKKLGLG